LPLNRFANLAPVPDISKVPRWGREVTQTVAVFPERLRVQLRDELALHGVQRVMSLGEMFTMDGVDPEQTYRLPHDGTEPNRRSVRWVIDQSSQPV
jgi:Acyl-CoA reductase (LuxC)